MSRIVGLMILVLGYGSMNGQNIIKGTVTSENIALDYATIAIAGLGIGTSSGQDGTYEISGVADGAYEIEASFLGYETLTKKIVLDGGIVNVSFDLKPGLGMMDEIVVTGTMKSVSKLESPIPVEVFRPVFFKKNPTPNIYEALQTVNGVRPQLNCQVCNTGDIHINGLEGPYTMVLIDGMPIVSSLATVYGLSGIPNSLVERMEIVKGPASSLYGSEAIGGLINIITKNPSKAKTLSADIFSTTWGEVNADLGLKLKLGKNIHALTGVNYYRFDNVIDNNNDNFTDLTLQDRLSIFQKWSFDRKDGKLASIAGRFYTEKRWGGELDWDEKLHRGGDQVYGESIYTDRWELLGQYQLPTAEALMLSVSINGHKQNSVYGDLPYTAEQNIGFGQLTWDKNLRSHSLLVGAALRYTYYDDNTPATRSNDANGTNSPDEILLPGIFVQDEITFNPKSKLLLGLRYDYNVDHGNIITPRIAYKWSPTKTDIIRFNAGKGFRVVNLFTEDHAALTGARDVVITEELEPEESYNLNLNYTKKFYFSNGSFMSFDATSWYTYFTNIILPDYETDASKIIYNNLDGHSVTKGVSLNIDMAFNSGFSLLAGGTLMDVSSTENGITERQILTERFSGTWGVSYKMPNDKISFDYTGNIYGPMRLPLLSDLDPRPGTSPWWSIQNLQMTWKANKSIEVYGGVKNLLNWTPWKNQDHPIIARSFDPFDRGVEVGNDGLVLSTASNLYALSFDPSYVYAPNQGIRGFLGLRFTLD